jgi:hypothetical protein
LKDNVWGKYLLLIPVANSTPMAMKVASIVWTRVISPSRIYYCFVRVVLEVELPNKDFEKLFVVLTKLI